MEVDAKIVNKMKNSCSSSSLPPSSITSLDMKQKSLSEEKASSTPLRTSFLREGDEGKDENRSVDPNLSVDSQKTSLPGGGGGNHFVKGGHSHTTSHHTLHKKSSSSSPSLDEIRSRLKQIGGNGTSRPHTAVLTRTPSRNHSSLQKSEVFSPHSNPTSLSRGGGGLRCIDTQTPPSVAARVTPTREASLSLANRSSNSSVYSLSRSQEKSSQDPSKNDGDHLDTNTFHRSYAPSKSFTKGGGIESCCEETERNPHYLASSLLLDSPAHLPSFGSLNSTRPHTALPSGTTGGGKGGGGEQAGGGGGEQGGAGVGRGGRSYVGRGGGSSLSSRYFFDMGLDGAERHDLLITVHELLAYLEVVERFRQKAVEDSSRLRQYCTELGCMLKQANEREERGHREVEKQRNFLLTCQAQIQALKNTTDTAMNELRTQRDMLAERLNVTTVELENLRSRCKERPHALKENERLLLEREAQEIAVRDGQNVRKAYAFLEEEKKQLQNEVEALRVELSKAQSERNSLLAEMHALRDRALLSPHLFENQEQPLQLQQEEEERERQRGEEEKDNREKNEEEEGWQRDTRDGREGHGGEEEEDGEFEVLVEELFLTSRDRSEKKYKTTEDPHDDERNQERKRREKVDKILAIYKNLREEKNEYHGYAVELLNRLDSATSSSHTNEEFQGGSSSSSPSGQHLSDAMMHATRSQANGLLHSSSSSSSPSPSSSICRNTTGSQRNLSNDVCSPSSSSSLSSSTSSFSRDTQSRQRTAREGERDEEFLSRHPYHAGSPLPSSSCSFTPSSSSSTPCVSAASSSSSSNFPCEEKRKKSQKESGEKEDKDEEEHTRLNGLPLDVCMVESEGMSQAT